MGVLMNCLIKLYIPLLTAAICGSVYAQNDQNGERSKKATTESSRPTGDAAHEVLPETEWRRVDAAVDRALTWVASQQQADGSFPTIEMGQPGVTSLCMMA